MRNGLMAWVAATVLFSAVGEAKVLVVKTKDAGGKSLLAQFEKKWKGTEIGNGARYVAPAFEKTNAWGPAATDFPYDNYFVIALNDDADPAKMAALVASVPGVESVEPDVELTDPDFALPRDPKLKDQWYLKNLKVAEAWEVTRGEGIFVADVESGWDTNHPDLVHQFDMKRSHDYDPETDNPDKINDNKMNHGTPVAGLIAAEANNGKYGAGIAYNARLIGSQMANSMKAHSTTKIWTVNTAKAILGSIERGAHVILIEKQVPDYNSSVEHVKVIYDAIKAAVDRGVAVVVPAGNFSSELKFEASQPDSGSIFVGAVDPKERPESFSNYGERLNVSAFGENVYSIQEGDSETQFSGTSSASAITAGIVGLVRAANPKLTPRQVRQVLVETGKAIKSPEPSFMGPLTSVARLVETSARTKVGSLLQAGPAVRRALQFK